METIYKYSMSFKTSLIVWGLILVAFLVTMIISHEIATANKKESLVDCNISKVNYNDDESSIRLNLNCPFGEILDEGVTNKYKFLRNPPKVVKCYEVKYKAGTSRGCKI